MQHLIIQKGKEHQDDHEATLSVLAVPDFVWFS